MITMCFEIFFYLGCHAACNEHIEVVKTFETISRCNSYLLDNFILSSNLSEITK